MVGKMSRFTKSFIDNSKLLKKYLARFLSEDQDIDDVLQETYLRACSAASSKEIEHPKAFIFKVAKNIALNELTKKSQQITDYIEDCHPSIVIENELAVENEVQARQTLGVYCEALGALPEKCRKVYLLRKVHGLSHQEIAECMNLSVSSVEKYLTKGVLHCKAYVEKHENPRIVASKPMMILSSNSKDHK